MDTTGERIKFLREKKGFSQPKLAEILGKKYNAEISRWERNERTPTVTTTKKLAEVLDSTIEWILYGTGDMDAKQEAEKTQSVLQPVERLIHLYEISSVRAGRFSMVAEIGQDFSSFPIPIEFLPQKAQKMTQAEILKTFYVFVVKGESMLPSLREGWIVVVEKIESFEQMTIGDCVIAINRDSEIVVKRLKKKNGVLVLESDNPDKHQYPDIEIEADIQAVAKVIFFAGKP